MSNLSLGCSPCPHREVRGWFPQVRNSFWQRRWHLWVVFFFLSFAYWLLHSSHILDSKIHKNSASMHRYMCFEPLLLKSRLITPNLTEIWSHYNVCFHLCFLLLHWFEEIALPFSLQKLPYGVLHHTRRRFIGNYHKISSFEQHLSSDSCSWVVLWPGFCDLALFIFPILKTCCQEPVISIASFTVHDSCHTNLLLTFFQLYQKQSDFQGVALRVEAGPYQSLLKNNSTFQTQRSTRMCKKIHMSHITMISPFSSTLTSETETQINQSSRKRNLFFHLSTLIVQFLICLAISWQWP